MNSVMPQVIAVGEVIAGNSQAVFALESVLCWPAGFTFSVSVFVREDADLWLVHHPKDPRHVPDLDGPCIGVLFSDGTKLTNVDQLYFDPYVVAPSLTPASGTSGLGWARQGMYVQPLPSPGPLVVAARWLSRGLAEHQIVLDGDLVIAAAGRAVAVWQ